MVSTFHKFSSPGLMCNGGVERRPQDHLSLLERILMPNVPQGFVKLLRLRRSSGKRMLLHVPPSSLGSPLRACHFGPTLEAFPHLLAVVRRRP